MTETNQSAEAAPKKRAGGLNTMLIADLKSMAGGLGIAGAGSMKKADLVAAIKAAQSGSQSGGQSKDRPAQARDQKAAPDQPQDQPQDQSGNQPGNQSGNQPKDGPRNDGRTPGKQDQGKQDQGKQQGKDQSRSQGKDQPKGQGKQDQPKNQNKQDQGKQQDQSKQDQNKQQDGQDGDGDGSSRSRRRRGRDRNRAGGGRNEPDTTVLEDDVLVPAAGIVDVLDNYAFVRTSGYLPGPDDVYLSLSLVRKFGLRRGDAVVGQVRQPREGERREKFNPMVRIDSVNGSDPQEDGDRPVFGALTPVHPDERLRLETGSDDVTGRLIDLVAPIGKGQRGLIVSPAGAGKTALLQAIAGSVTANNPECHLMVVLVDERPEEVTDFERSVKGEVISSTFDRPPGDHTSVAELAIERAQRLVELGHDVVVLVDGLTRLGRAYNLAAPANGRVLAGGVDSSALHPPKRIFGAARNIEDGGSLTILATAGVDSGSAMDEVILEELEGTSNLQLRLSRELADHRLFPAVDVAQSGTRHVESLMSEQELAIVRGLRLNLGEHDSRGALEQLLDRLGRTQTNIELLRQAQQSAG